MSRSDACRRKEDAPKALDRVEDLIKNEPCAVVTDEPRRRKNLRAGIIFRYRRKEIFRSVGILLRLRMSLRSGSTPNPSNAPWIH